MTYHRFEDLPVWKNAEDLALRIYTLTDHPCFRERGDLVDQLRRSSLSISNNIAEGFERGTTSELLNFLYIARGSAGETRSQLHFASLRARYSPIHSQLPSLMTLAESCSRQIRAWADSLQNSDIPGQRRLTDQTRETFEAKRRSEAFLQKLQAMTKHIIPQPTDEPEEPLTNQPPK